MITLTVSYPKAEGSTFDLDYYLTTHIPMVAGSLGDSVSRTTLTSGVDFGDQPTPFMIVIQFEIDSMESLGAAFAAHGDEIMGDIPNFTNVVPVVHVGTVIS